MFLLSAISTMMILGGYWVVIGGHKSPNIGYNRSYRTYNPTYNYITSRENRSKGCGNAAGFVDPGIRHHSLLGFRVQGLGVRVSGFVD